MVTSVQCGKYYSFIMMVELQAGKGKLKNYPSFCRADLFVTKGPVYSAIRQYENSFLFCIPPSKHG